MRTLQGTVVSNRMAKTVVVRVDRMRQHAKYRKAYRVSRKYKAHVEDAGGYQPGDTVRIQESRPLSKGTRWRVLAPVRRASAVVLDAQASAEGDVPRALP